MHHHRSPVLVRSYNPVFGLRIQQEIYCASAPSGLGFRQWWQLPLPMMLQRHGVTFHAIFDVAEETEKPSLSTVLGFPTLAGSCVGRGCVLCAFSSGRQLIKSWQLTRFVSCHDTAGHYVLWFPVSLTSDGHIARR